MIELGDDKHFLNLRIDRGKAQLTALGANLVVDCDQRTQSRRRQVLDILKAQQHFRNRRLRALLIFSFLYLLLVIFVIHGNPRYSLSLFACLSLLAGYVAHRVSASNRALAAVLNTAFAGTLLLNLLWSYELAKPGLGVVLGQQTREQFLGQREVSYRVFRFINTSLPEASVVLMQGMVRGYYCDRPYLWDHPYQALLAYGQYDTPAALRRRMQELGITHIVRLQRMPAMRREMYPDYANDPVHVGFAKSYLKPLYMDESFVLFEVNYTDG